MRTLALPDPKRRPARQPVLRATLDTEAEALLMRIPSARPDIIHVLRVWRAPALLDSGQPLWIGSTQTMRYLRPIPAVGLWMPQTDDGTAHARVRVALEGLQIAESAHPDGDLPVLLLRTSK